MAPKFGTSGVRGLVVELTDQVVSGYVQAFIAECETGHAVYVGWDLRESSPSIAQIVMRSAQDMGLDVVNCGVLPTPALAFAAGEAGQSAIMITGSHIPADRNGIKFYTPQGEITKLDETRINAAFSNNHPLADTPGSMSENQGAVTEAFMNRYLSGFAVDALSGLKIGVYQHSSVARDILVQLLGQLGAEVLPLERTTEFVPVDTEAVDPASRQKFADWCADHSLDALISTDGDADRPMVTDHTGQIVPGDVLGAMTAQYLGAEVLCTPVSSNSMIQHMSEFSTIELTKIGSPYVVAAIEQALASEPTAKVVGYEANGGFLLGFTALGLAPLLTRDCVLPILASLSLAHKSGRSLAQQVETLPQRFALADRIAGIETDVSKAFIGKLADSPEARADFFEVDGAEVGVDQTDGLRVSFDNDQIVHLRPSGNAPEFRCYAEAASPEAANALVHLHLGKIASDLS